MLRFAVLRFAVLRLAVLRFAVLRFAVLRLAVLFLAVPRRALDFERDDAALPLPFFLSAISVLPSWLA